MKRINTHPADRSLLITIFALLILGIVFIYNATVIYSQDVFGGPYRFVLLQIAWVSVGLLGFYFFYKFDYKNISKIAYPLFIVTIGMLGLLALIGLLPCSVNIIFSPCINGANRWFYLNPPPLPRLPILGILGFQPSELAKLSLILYLSVQIDLAIKKGNNLFTIFLVSTGLISFLIAMQPNMSTAVLVFMIGLVMYFASEAPLTPLLVLGPVGGVVGVLFMLVSSYRRERLLTFLGGRSEQLDASTGYHIKQILIALGSGGIFGVGFGQSRQKFQYLPEVAADSIFAVIGEELGFIGTTFLVLLFGYLIYKGYKIAQDAPDMLGRLLATGITTWIGLQFFINVAAMTRFIPLTGVPLPLISYGGSSMVFSLMGLGILANISSHESSNNRRTS
ncbi:MAG TPA: putative peptidoglycan glycosyltransferase FtsW [Candidatus Saccharimonadales bacterium]|nr:putative peptidoglycan glycosyltransferase FtsW [Candidatus Saccharimonadales bacterium]